VSRFRQGEEAPAVGLAAAVRLLMSAGQIPSAYA